VGFTLQDLASRKCAPCEGGVEPLNGEEARALLTELNSEWRLTDDGLSIQRRYEFPVFSRTIAFVNAVAWIATVEGHHPVLTVEYGSCDVSYTTHAINGLSDNDFICAAKIDQLTGSS